MLLAVGREGEWIIDDDLHRLEEELACFRKSHPDCDLYMMNDDGSGPWRLLLAALRRATDSPPDEVLKASESRYRRAMRPHINGRR